MNKTKKTIMALAAIFVIGAFAFTACGTSKPAETAPAKTETGSGKTEAPEPESESAQAAGDLKDYVGEYTLYAIGENNTLYSAEEYGSFIKSFIGGIANAFGGDEASQKELKDSVDFGASTLSLKENGEAELSVFGSSATCSWTVENGKIVFSVDKMEEGDDSMFKEGSSFSGTCEKGILRMTDPEDETDLVFAAEGADTSEIETSSLKDSLPMGSGGN